MEFVKTAKANGKECLGWRDSRSSAHISLVRGSTVQQSDMLPGENAELALG